MLASCWRPGSLDATISKSSEIPNDFNGFLPAHPQLQGIFFNGSKAEQVFRRLVIPQLGTMFADLPLTRLPSTSPAHAGKTLDSKIEDWRVLRDFIGL